MPITVDYTPVPAITELAKQAGQQVGKKWQAEYQQPFQLQSQQDISALERLQTQLKQSAEQNAQERTSALERLNLQITSSEKLSTSDNIAQMQRLNEQNRTAMERLQAGDFNTAQRLQEQIAADFERLNTTISAEDRQLAERNKAQLDAIYVGDYNTAQRLQTQIDADLKKTGSTQQYEREMTYKRAELERQMLQTTNQYDLQRLEYEKQLTEQSQMNLLSATYDFNTQFEMQKYQQSKQKEYDTIQQQKDEYDFISKEIDNNYTLTEEQKTTAKMIVRSKIMGYGGGGLGYADFGQETASDEIKRLTAENTAIKNQAQIDRWEALTGQGETRLGQGQQRIEQGNVRLDQNQQKIDDAIYNAKQQLDSIEYKYNTLSAYQQQQLLAKSPIVEEDGIYYIQYTDSITGQPAYDPIEENSSLVRQFKNLLNRTFEQSTLLPSGNQVNISGTGENKKYTVTYPNQSGQSQQLDQTTAIQILQEAGGDRNKARQIAISRGYKF